MDIAMPEYEAQVGVRGADEYTPGSGRPVRAQVHKVRGIGRHRARDNMFTCPDLRTGKVSPEIREMGERASRPARP
ncbi:hypothetical protein ACFUIY_09265 [Streptomyces griseorubiginosus]|uniref:hypothetical protein n=1 Tax=Streptomyces griseorubiginosus TaxID=67304 RepID=UPI00114035E2|nr:hypothetical protein [Streptomyces griseorubiginosus]